MMNRGSLNAVAGCGLLAACVLLASADGAWAREGVCGTTARVQAMACRSETAGDFFTGKALCLQFEDESRDECLAELAEEGREARELCFEQRSARRELCDEIGPGRYDPDFDPALFDADPGDPANPNPWFPTAVGNRWVYTAEDEEIEVVVRDATKLIEGVPCITFNDRVSEEGQNVEDTDDWYGVRHDGGVDYCGEISLNFELFEGDDPQIAELVDLGGSWKAGRGALSGTIMRAHPEPGDTYRQEYAPGEAEDVATVLANDYGWGGGDAELDAFVPQELAELLCDGDCVVTGEFTPIEPDVFERKYYAPGIGLFLEVEPESGDTVVLVECNLDPRCAALPAP